MTEDPDVRDVTPGGGADQEENDGSGVDSSDRSDADTGETRQPGADDGLAGAVRARLASLESGNYRANNELVLAEFASFLRRRRGVTRIEDVEPIDCRRYAQWLRERVADEDDPLSAASAHANGPYFTIVRAFLAWCVDDERLEANPARPNRVSDALPQYRGGPDRQFWTPEARDALLSFVDARVREELDGAADPAAVDHVSAAVDRDAAEALDPTPFRDRAVVATLAFTGVRGAEVFADPRDDHRDGLRWEDVDLDRGVARVLGKTRERQSVALTDDVVHALRQYRTVFDPAGEDWPVFPTRHRPSLSRTARERLAERGWSDAEIEAALDDASGMALLRRHDIAPPALSKNGARNLMQRLCDAADVDVDGEYLKPHGGRRALGDQLYAADAELAQETLRHESIETTHEAYRDQDAVERRERIEDVLDGE